MKDALKVIRNKHDKPQLYKKDHSIPNDQPDLNTRTFVTPLREKAPAKNSKKVAATGLLRKDPKLEQHYKDLADYEAAYQKKLDNAIKNGDSKRRQGAFKAKITEAKGERAAAMYMEKHFATPPPPAQMELGFGPGPGVDQIWSKRDKDGKVLEYFVVEAKGPGAKLQKTKTKGMQMSNEWVEKNLTAMKKSKKYPEKNQLGKDLLNAKKSRIKVNKLVIEAVEENGNLIGGKPQPSPLS